MDEEAMWRGFYHKIVEEKEEKEKERKEKSEHDLRLQEEDGGFFEKLGTILADKVRAQELEEGPIPEKKDLDNANRDEQEETSSETESVLGCNEALLETDSDRDETEIVQNFLMQSVGWNISIMVMFRLLLS